MNSLIPIRLAHLLATILLVGCGNNPDAWKEPIRDAVLKPERPGTAGGATPEELAKLYEEVHRAKDMQRYRQFVDEHLTTLRDWTPTDAKRKEHLSLLFDFELTSVRLEKTPPETKPENAVVYYLCRTTDGGQGFSCSTLGLPAAGKLVLEGRWPGGDPVQLDPGLAVVEAPTSAGNRFFVSRDATILARGLLSRARAERSDGADHFRAMPLGATDLTAAFEIPGTRTKSRYTKTWEEAVRDLERFRQQQ